MADRKDLEAEYLGVKNLRRAAVKRYIRGCPIRINVKSDAEYKVRIKDIEYISNARSDEEASVRVNERLRKLEYMFAHEPVLAYIKEAFGKIPKVFGQEHVIAMEHVYDRPYRLDPHTQVPLWHQGIRETSGGKTMDRKRFEWYARRIFCQHKIRSDWDE